MARVSKQVAEIQKKVANAIHVMTTYGEQVANQAEAALLEEGSQTQAEMGVLQLLKGLLAKLNRDLARLEQDDDNVFSELGQDQTAQNNRDEQLQHTRDTVIRFRKQMEGTYGMPFAVELGLTGDTPQDPTLLNNLLRGMHDTLSKKKSLPPPLDPEDPTWTVKQLQNKIEGMRKPLQEAEDLLKKDLKETQDAQIKRRASLKTTNLSLQTFHNVFESLARMVGLHEIADRIRPAGGRPSSTKDDSQDSEGGTGNPPTENPS